MHACTLWRHDNQQNFRLSAIGARNIYKSVSDTIGSATIDYLPDVQGTDTERMLINRDDACSIYSVIADEDGGMLLKTNAAAALEIPNLVE